MKSKFNPRHLLFLLLLLATVSRTHAQSKQSYLPENGSYQLISNKHDMHTTTVQFFDSNQQLIYEETVYGKKFNLRRRKVLLCLDLCLTKALQSWNYKKEALHDKNWLAASLSK